MEEQKRQIELKLKKNQKNYQNSNKIKSAINWKNYRKENPEQKDKVLILVRAD